MKTIILYYSSHHGNTRKIVQAAEAAIDTDILDITSPMAEKADLSEYDRIGIASGIYAGSFHPDLIEYIKKHMPRGKEVFLMYTCTADMPHYINRILRVLEGADAKVIGRFRCRGFNTFGPFGVLGGAAKGHPDVHDLMSAADFVRNLKSDGSILTSQKKQKKK